MILHAPPQSAPLNHIKVTESLQGVAVPLVFGTARISGKLIYDADLVAHPESSSGKAKGGKSGLYAYTGTFIAALCEGPILGILSVWDQQGMLPMATQQQSLGKVPSAPGSGPAMTSTAGGSLGARSYYSCVSYVYANGESATSPVSGPDAIAADFLGVVDSPVNAAGVTGWNVYVGTSPGSLTLQNSTPLAIGVNWTEPTSGIAGTGKASPTQPIVPPTPPGPTGGGSGDGGGNNWNGDGGVGDGNGPLTRRPVE